jgi:hypothetical protein
MHVHAAPCCARIVRDCSASNTLQQESSVISKVWQVGNACSVFLSVRTRLEASEMGVHTVLSLCERSVGVALRVQIDHRSGTPHCLSCPVIACAAHAPLPGGRALTRRRPAERPARRASRTPVPRWDHGAPRVRPHRGPGARGGADGLPRMVENLDCLYPIEVAQVGCILDRTISSRPPT